MVKVKEENRRKLGVEALFEAVIARALEDALFLKKKVTNRKIGKKVKYSYGIVKKADAVTWLKGENDYEGLDFVCTAAGIPTEKLVKKCRKWFSGEHSDGYEFSNKKEAEDVLGIKIRIVDRE